MPRDQHTECLITKAMETNNQLFLDVTVRLTGSGHSLEELLRNWFVWGIQRLNAEWGEVSCVTQSAIREPLAGFSLTCFMLLDVVFKMVRVNGFGEHLPTAHSYGLSIRARALIFTILTENNSSRSPLTAQQIVQLHRGTGDRLWPPALRFVFLRSGFVAGRFVGRSFEVMGREK